MTQQNNDLFLDILDNPTFTINDFMAVGLTPSNTTINQNKDLYKKNDLVKQKFTKSDGTFDQKAFDLSYAIAVGAFNALQKLRTIDYDELVGDLPFLDNSLLNNPLKEKSNNKVIPTFTKISDKIATPSIGMTELGLIGDRTKTIEEIAEGEKVLKNPIEVKKGAKPIWEEAPESGIFSLNFWKNLANPRVLATYDSDGTHIDPATGLKVLHSKGLYKLNDFGKPYYENLEGRNVYGKQVLNHFNILTPEDSFLNKIDCLDSDGMEEQNLLGVINKNLLLVGSMFIPYVGPYIALASMGMLTLNLSAKLGKMISGGDSSFLNQVEGFAKSFDRLGLKSEYARNHTWCLENIISSIGDLTAQLKEQRAIFDLIPSIKFGVAFGKNGFNGDKIKKLLAKELEAKDLGSINKIQLGKQVDIKPIKDAIKQKASLEADIAYLKLLTNYEKLGANLGKMYMAGLISSNLYEEAKLNGLSDNAARWLTLGRFGAEMMLLNTPMGDVIFPELRVELQNMTGMIEKGFLSKEAKAIENAVEKNLVAKETEYGLNKKIYSIIDSESAKVIPGNKASLIGFILKLMNIGRGTANKASLVARRGKTLNTITAAFASGTEIGIINDIEEFLNDSAKQCYNFLNDLNPDQFNNPFKDEFAPWKNKLDRYGMGMVSGLVGGTITSGFTAYHSIADISKLLPKEARQLLTYMYMNGYKDLILKSIDKHTWGNEGLSTKLFEDSDYNERMWLPGTKTDNQNTEIKNFVKTWFSTIENIINTDGLKLSKNLLLSKALLDNLKLSALVNTSAATKFVSDYTNLAEEICNTEININKLLKPAGSENETDRLATHNKTLSTEQQTLLDYYKNNLKELIKKKDLLFETDRIASFIQDAVYEASSSIKNSFRPFSFEYYAQQRLGKSWLEIKNDEKLKVRIGPDGDITKDWEAVKSSADDMTSINSASLVNMIEILSSIIEENGKPLARLTDKNKIPNDISKEDLKKVIDLFETKSSPEFRFVDPNTNIPYIVTNEDKKTYLFNEGIKFDKEGYSNIKGYEGEGIDYYELVLSKMIDAIATPEEIAILRDYTSLYNDLAANTKNDELTVEKNLYKSELSNNSKRFAEFIVAKNLPKISNWIKSIPVMSMELREIFNQVFNRLEDNLNKDFAPLIMEDPSFEGSDLIVDNNINFETLLNADKIDAEDLDILKDILKNYFNPNFSNPGFKDFSRQIIDYLKNDPFYLNSVTSLDIQNNDFFLSKLHNEIEDLRQNINDKPFTNIEEALNKALPLVTGLTWTLSDLFLELDNIYNTSAGLATMNFPVSAKKKIETALSLIDNYEVALLSVSVSQTGSGNLFGFSYTLNQANKNIGNTKWKPLLELDEKNTFVQMHDLYKVRQQLLYYSELIDLLTGLKIFQSKNLAIAKYRNMFAAVYNLFRETLSNNIDLFREDTPQYLKLFLNDNTRYYQLRSDKSPDQFTDEEYSELILEYLDFSHALHLSLKDFDESQIKNLLRFDENFSSNNLAFFTQKSRILSPDDKSLNDNRLFYWDIAKIAAFDPLVFYKKMLKIIGNEKKLVPLLPQLELVQGNIAFIVNQKTKNTFVNTLLDYAKDVINSGRKSNNTTHIKRVFGVSENVAQMIIQASSMGENAQAQLFAPIIRYANILFNEGIAGSGKTSAVLYYTRQFLKTYYPELCQNEVFVHAASINKAKEVAENITGEKSDTLKYYTLKSSDKKEQFFDSIISDDIKTSFSKKDLENTKQNNEDQLCSPIKTNKTTTNTSIIYVDEILLLSTHQLYALQLFAEENNIMIIGSGDTTQVGHIDSLEITALGFKQNYFSKLLSAHCIPTGFKLSSAIRTGSNVKTENEIVVELLFNHTVFPESIKIQYGFDENNNLVGDLITNKGEDLGFSDIEKFIIKARTDLDLDNKEKIGFMCASKNTPLGKYLLENYGDIILIYEGASALSEESRYYIIEPNNSLLEPHHSFDWLEYFYTGITRGKNATITYIGNHPLSDLKLTDINENLGRYVNIQMIPTEATTITQEYLPNITQRESFSNTVISTYNHAISLLVLDESELSLPPILKVEKADNSNIIDPEISRFTNFINSNNLNSVYIDGKLWTVDTNISKDSNNKFNVTLKYGNEEKSLSIEDFENKYNQKEILSPSSFNEILNNFKTAFSITDNSQIYYASEDTENSSIGHKILEITPLTATKLKLTVDTSIDTNLNKTTEYYAYLDNTTDENSFNNLLDKKIIRLTEKPEIIGGETAQDLKIGDRFKYKSGESIRELIVIETSEDGRYLICRDLNTDKNYIFLKKLLSNIEIISGSSIPQYLNLNLVAFSQKNGCDFNKSVYSYKGINIVGLLFKPKNSVQFLYQISFEDNSSTHYLLFKLNADGLWEIDTDPTTVLAENSVLGLILQKINNAIGNINGRRLITDIPEASETTNEFNSNLNNAVKTKKILPEKLEILQYTDSKITQQVWEKHHAINNIRTINENESTQFSISPENGRVLIDRCLHTFNTNELGFSVERIDEFKKSGADFNTQFNEFIKNNSKNRIDSINGLYKLKKRSSLLTFEDYVNTLHELKSAIWTRLINKNGELISENDFLTIINTILSAEGFNTIADSGFDIILEHYNPDHHELFDTNEEYKKFNINTTEQIDLGPLYEGKIYNPSTNKIWYVFKDSQGNRVFSLPVYTLDNVITLLGAFFKKYKTTYPDLAKIYTNEIKNSQRTIDGLKNIAKSMASDKSLINLKNIVDFYLGESVLYEFPSTVSYNENLSLKDKIRSINSIGPDFNNRSGVYDVNNRRIDFSESNPNEWNSINTTIQNQPLVSTDVLISTGREQDKDGPIVIYSSDLSLKTEELIIKLYINESDPDYKGPIVTHKVFVRPPVLTFLQFIDLILILLSNSNHHHSANIDTSYLILSYLWTNQQKFADVALWNDTLRNKIKLYLGIENGILNTQLFDFLEQKVQSPANEKFLPRHLILDSLLKETFIQPSVSQNNLSTYEYIYKDAEKMTKLFGDSEGGQFKYIYAHPKLIPLESNTNIEGFAHVVTNDRNAWRIPAVINPPVFKFNFENVLSPINTPSYRENPMLSDLKINLINEIPVEEQLQEIRNTRTDILGCIVGEKILEIPLSLEIFNTKDINHIEYLESNDPSVILFKIYYNNNDPIKYIGEVKDTFFELTNPELIESEETLDKILDLNFNQEKLDFIKFAFELNDVENSKEAYENKIKENKAIINFDYVYDSWVDLLSALEKSINSDIAEYYIDKEGKEILQTENDVKAELKLIFDEIDRFRDSKICEKIRIDFK